MPKFKHLLLENQVYFVTTSTKGKRRVFLDPESAGLVLEILQELRREGLAQIYAFALMPDHLHVLLKPEKEPLPKIIQRIKGKSSRLINRMEKRKAPLWQAEYYERAVRDEQDFEEKYNYIVFNPVKAGLSERPEGFPFSSEFCKDLVDAL